MKELQPLLETQVKFRRVKGGPSLPLMLVQFLNESGFQLAIEEKPNEGFNHVSGSNDSIEILKQIFTTPEYLALQRALHPRVNHTWFAMKEAMGGLPWSAATKLRVYDTFVGNFLRGPFEEILSHKENWLFDDGSNPILRNLQKETLEKASSEPLTEEEFRSLLQPAINRYTLP